MTNILLSGCNGRMGQAITRLVEQMEDLRIVAGLDMNNAKQNPYPVYAFTSIESCDITPAPDVIIDFSNPAVFDSLLSYATKKKLPIVVATTGLSTEQVKHLEECSESIPVFFSANMSLGVNLLIDLVEKAAQLLYENFDIEIIEKHHNMKVDAPSGTALAIADSINAVLDNSLEYTYERQSKNERRNKKELGIHSLRGGTIVGEHSVIFAGNDEILEIKHSATSREIFCVGALNAAKFIAQRAPGLYSMKELVESK